MKKKFFWRTCVFFICFGHWAKKFGILSKNFQALLSKMRSTIPLEGKGLFFKTKNYISCFADFYREIFGFLSKAFQRGCQNCILLVHWKFLSESVFWKIYVFLNTFLSLSEKWSAYCSKTFRGVVTTASFLYIATIWAEKIFFDFWKTYISKLFGEWVGNSWFLVGGIVKSALYVSIKKLEEKMFSGKNSFFIKFGPWMKNFCICRENSGVFIKTTFYVYIIT